jgi:hypothetical protein
MAMARQFFDAQNATALGPFFSPAQTLPIQDLASSQLSVVPASRLSTTNFNGTWGETERAQSLSQNTLPLAAWASEFSSGVFSPGPVAQQSVTPVKGAFTL